MSSKPKKPIEAIIEGLEGHYPLDAFLLVQECISVASEQVHGPMTPNETKVARWMASNDIDLDQLHEIHAQDALPPDISRAIEEEGGLEHFNRHVTGQQLCWTIRDVAQQRWGLMAKKVLARWNITCTEDIGKIIFALVENDWLQKQPTDRIEDFDNVFSFDDAFDRQYKIAARLKPGLQP